MPSITNQDLVKRTIDTMASALALVALSPVIAVVAVLVRRTVGSPVIFRQTRPGRNGVPFVMYKFRTMLDLCDEAGVPLADSERLTSIGATLRRASLDELPELWNVLRGDMSLVGPRPLLMRYTKFFTETERERLAVRPGITGLAQVRGRNTTRWDERLALDVEYVQNRSLILDLQLLLRTAFQVVRTQGAIADPSSIMLNLDEEREIRTLRD